MIVSHEHRFIFLKTRKTAGTSVEIGLTPFCGEGDIVSALSPDDERLRIADGKVQARNYVDDPAIAERYARMVLEDAPGAIDLLRTFSTRPGSFYNHMPAGKVKPLLGDATWDGYYKFTIERNPWDRMVSRYYWKTRTKWLKPSFSRFLRESLEGTELQREDNLEIYSLDGKVAVDHIIRYENLGAELTQLSERLGLGGPLQLPHAKGGKRKRPGYRELYNEADRRLVAERFGTEIELLGYRF